MFLVVLKSHLMIGVRNLELILFVFFSPFGVIPQKYRFRNGGDTASTRHPVNHFISNEDTLVVMKSMLSEGNTHEKLAASNDTLESFFGSDPNGLSLFHELSEDEWKE